MRKAMNKLSSKGIVPDMIGSGKVAWQSPSPGHWCKVEIFARLD